MKKKIIFSAPINLIKQRKIEDGYYVLQWNVPIRLFRWLKSLLPNRVEKDARYFTVYDIYLAPNEKGELVKINKPEINPETEELVTNIALCLINQ